MKCITHRTLVKSLALITMFLVCGCGQTKRDQPQNEPSHSPDEKLVTFDVPKDWVLQNHLVNSNSESYQFFIPDPATDGTSDSANAVISMEPSPIGMTVTNFSSSRLESAPDSNGYAMLTRIFAGGKWCNAVTHGQQDTTPYLIMDRFGVDQGMMVVFRLAQPILKNNQDTVALSISNFNAVSRSLKIGGTNMLNSEMREDHGTIWLRAFSDTDTNWMTSSTNIPIYRSPLQTK